MKVVEMLKKLHVSVPFTKFHSQMPTYVKFLKEIVSKKRRLEEHEAVAMTATSSIVIRSTPLKLKNSGSFSIPYQLGTMDFKRALCDLEAIVSLMILPVCVVS